MHSDRQSAVFLTLDKLTRQLAALKVTYAVAGGLAVFFHGYRRFAEDVDILLTREGLQRFHKHLDELGYEPLSSSNRKLRDRELGVRIQLLVCGDFPGDGKPKPVAFPDPSDARIERDGIQWLDLPSLIDVKLASGIAVPARLRDLADVQELIRVLKLPEDFSLDLEAFVREKYVDLWDAAQEGPWEYPD